MGIDAKVDRGRRSLLTGAAAWTAVSYGRVLGANNRVRIAGIGTGGRCQHLLSIVKKAPGTEIVALCDVYEPRRQSAKEKFAPEAKEYIEYRHVLDRKDIDAVIIGSPDHWHTPMTIDSVRGGKDVYVEKPVTHTIAEGALLQKAVDASGRVVQVGYQQRSWPHFQQARNIIASGALGQIPLVLTYWYQNHMDERDPADGAVDPSKLDWERWLGSAPARPFQARRFLSWRWFWDYGGGAMTDLFSHWVDVVHWCMDVNLPEAAQAMGERYLLPNLDCPDTLSAYLRYPGFSVSYVSTLNGLHEGGGVVFRGTNAMLKLHRGGLAVYPEQTRYTETPSSVEPAQQARSQRDGTIDHVQNFLDCVRSRNIPNTPVSVAIAGARAGHIGNLALRTGKTIRVPDDVPGVV